jgi:hypothetical protein
LHKKQGVILSVVGCCCPPEAKDPYPHDNLPR